VATFVRNGGTRVAKKVNKPALWPANDNVISSEVYGICLRSLLFEFQYLTL